MAISLDGARNAYNEKSSASTPRSSTMTRVEDTQYITQVANSIQTQENLEIFREALGETFALIPEIAGKLIAGAAILPLVAISIVFFPLTISGLFLTSSGEQDIKEGQETRGQVKVAMGVVLHASFILALYCIYHCFREELQGQI